MISTSRWFRNTGLFTVFTSSIAAVFSISIFAAESEGRNVEPAGAAPAIERIPIPCEDIQNPEQMRADCGGGGNPPGVPSSISAPSSNGTGNYTVSWGYASGQVQKYQLYVNKTGNNLWALKYSGSSRNYSVSNQASGTYRYRVRACNYQNQCGGFRYSGNVVVNTLPGVPSYLSVPSTNTNGSYTVSWGSGSGLVTRYELQEKLNSGGWVGRYSGTSRSKAFSGKADGSYTYRVRSCNSSTCSSYRTSGVLTVLKIPGTPSSISVPASPPGNFTISWGASAGQISSYKLEEKVGANPWSQIYSGTTRNFSVSGRANGPHQYRVKGCNASGCSGLRSSSTITVNNPPGAPASISAPSDDDDGAYTVNWTSATGNTTAYKLEEQFNGGSWSQVYSGTGFAKAFSGKADGTYGYRVRACNGNGCSGYRGPANVSVNEVRDEPEPAPAPHLEPIPSIDIVSEQVGAIPGEFRVGEAGEMTYNVALKIPAGTAGVAPDLSLSYSSHADNGHLGMGWSLGGQSGITRCGKTVEQDGLARAVDFTNQDRFCLDGQRLMVVSGSYGANGAEYKTELDSQTRIRSYGSSQGGDPVYFKVWRADGSVSDYGNTTDSRIEPYGKYQALHWLLNRMQDSLGNYIDYQYTEDQPNGEFVLARIDYTGKLGASPQAPYNHVNFVYDSNREDKMVRYFHGSKTTIGKRLARIDIFDNNQIYGSYHLGYSYGLSTTRSTLLSLQHCIDAVKTSCISPTYFYWQYKFLNSYSYQRSSTGADYLGFTPIDVDGNGMQDLAYTRKSGSYYYVYLDFSNGSELQTASNRILLSSNRDDSQVMAGSMRAVDYNGDGLQDLMLLKKCGSSFCWYIYESQRNNLKTSGRYLFNASTTSRDAANKAAERTFLIDFNADGNGDLVYYRASNPRVRLITRNSNGTMNIGGEQLLSVSAASSNADATSVDKYNFPQVGDFDGDGRADFIFKVTRTWYDDGGGGGDDDCFQNPDARGKGPDSENYIPTPCGPTDQYGTTTQKAWKVFLSQGNSLVEKMHLSYSNISNKDIKIADINGDGLSDALVNSGNDTTWYPYLSTGKYMTSQGSLTGIQNHEQMRFVDFNADGRMDIAYPDSTWKFYLWEYGTGTTGYPATRYSSSIATGNVNNHSTLFMDLNGDYKPDWLAVDFSSKTRKWKPSNHPDRGALKIDQVINGLGARTEIKYKPITNASVYTQETSGWQNQCWGACSPVIELMAPFYVVAEAKSSAPAAGTSPGSVDVDAKSSITYHYKGAKVQGGGRGFLGFSEVRTLDVQSNVLTATKYRQDFPYTGKPKETTVTWLGPIDNGDDTPPPPPPCDDCLPPPCLDGGNGPTGQRIVADCDMYGPTAKSANAGNILISKATTNWQSVNVIASGRVKRVQQQSAVDRQYDFDNGGALLSQVVTTNWYDSHGNSTKVQVDAKNAAGSLLSRKITENTYTNNLSAWHLGRLTLGKVTHSRPGKPSKVLETAFAYNSTNGLLIREVVEPNGNEREKLVTAYQYDAYGNKIKVTTCSTHVANCGVTTTQQPTNPLYVNRWNISTMDSQGRKIVKTTNSLGHVEREILSWSIYGPLASRDTNGNLEDAAYDRFGNVYFSRDYSGKYHRSTTRRCGGAVTCPAGAKVRTEKLSAGAPITRSYTDVLGREIRQSKQGFDGRFVNVDMEYDLLGRLKRQSEPYFDGETRFWTTSHYDAVGRMTSAVAPDGAVTTTNYDGLSKVSTNSKSQTLTLVNNLLGEKVSVTDNLGGVVTYQYDAMGSLTGVTGPTGHTVAVGYDRLGRKISTSDPDKGLTTYAYNALGLVVSQRDAKLQVTEQFFDSIGRVIRRVDKKSNGTIAADSRWEYDTSTNGIGATAVERDFVSGFVREFFYDEFSRNHLTAMTIDGQVYTSEATFDQYGRSYQEFDGSGGYRGTRQTYNQYGYPSEIREELTGDLYQKILAMDARGNVTRSRAGNGLETTRAFTSNTGRIAQIMTGGNGVIQDLRFQFDSLGNLTSRQELSGNKNLSDTFFYDGLNRLRQANTSGGENKTYQYDAAGNIIYKSDVGTYNYGQGAAGPHAVTSTSGVGGNQSYAYDANGNMVSGAGRAIQYSTFDKATSIAKSGHTTQFKYDTARVRYQRTDIDNQGTTKRHYVGSIEVIYKPNGQVEYRRVIGPAIVTHTYSGATLIDTTTQYLHSDHLGSLDVVTNASGELIDEFSFDAFGKRRNAVNWASLSLASIASNFTIHNLVTNTGYTGHEQLDAVGVVHMNGRIYDANLGRFMQADPHIQSPSDSQSLNRYSYVLNNPLSYTDPTGFFFKAIGKFFKKFWRTIVAVAITAVATIAGFGFGGVVAAGFLSGFVTSGNLKGALLGAFSSAAFFGVGEIFKAGSAIAKGLASAGKAVAALAKAGAHAIVGGVMSSLQGGKFGHGMLSAGVSSLTGPLVDNIGSSGNWSSFGNRMVRISSSAAVGGSVSALTGGKFANGAITSAYSRAFNDELHHQMSRQQSLQSQEVKATAEDDNAAISWVNDNRTKGLNLDSVTSDEYATWGAHITQPDGTKYTQWGRVQFFEGGRENHLGDTLYGGTMQFPKGADILIHSHPTKGNRGFSSYDLGDLKPVLTTKKIIPYVYTAANKTLYRYEYKVVMVRKHLGIFGPKVPKLKYKSSVVKKWP